MSTVPRNLLLVLAAVLLVVTPTAAAVGAGEIDDDGFSEDDIFDDDDDDVVEEQGGFIDDDDDSDFDFDDDDDDGDDDRRTDLDGEEVASGLDAELVLRDVEAFDVDLDDDEEEFLRFVFDSTIDEVGDERGFRLVGTDPEDEVEAVIAVRDRDDRRAVIVGFEPGTDVESFPLALAEPETVENRDGEGNPPTSIVVPDATVDLSAGRTIGPDLVGIRPQSSLRRAIFDFDERLDEDDRPSASDFGFVTSGGDVVEGDEVGTVEDRTVVVRFDEDLGDAVRFFVDGDAVTDPEGNDNAPGTLGAETSLPDLVDVDRTGDDTWTFVFDQDVIDPEIDGFHLRTVTGEVLIAEDLADVDIDGDDDERTTDDGAVIPVRFDPDEIEELGNEIVLGIAERGAVASDTAGRAASTLGVEAVAREDLAGGPTVGPDVESVSLGEDGEVTFLFDDRIEDVDGDGFQLVTESGRLVSAVELVETDDESVTVAFDEADVDELRSAVVRAGAVEDATGSPNPLSTTTRG